MLQSQISLKANLADKLEKEKAVIADDLNETRCIKLGLCDEVGSGRWADQCVYEVNL
jgi:hypothetical protein